MAQTTINKGLVVDQINIIHNQLFFSFVFVLSLKKKHKIHCTKDKIEPQYIQCIKW